jgi:hypothetical protein
MSDPVRNYDHKTIQFRRGTTDEWRMFGSKCIPAEAEICVEFFQTSTGARNGSVGIKVGNGVSTYSQLPHVVSDEESDPVFTSHPAYQITQELIDSWNDDAEGIGDAPNTKTYSRKKGVWVEAPTLKQVTDLEAKVDAIDPDGGSTVSWGEIENKPTEFPPAVHNHDGDYLKTETDPTVPAHVKSITQTDIDSWNAGGSGGASTWDELTGKPTEFPPESHTHEQSEVDGLELRLDAIEDSITSGGGFVDAPDDGKLYGRQSENWAEVVIPDAADPDWADIENKPTEFPPEDHDQPWSSITDKPAKFPPADHTHDYLSDAPDDGAQYARQSVNSKMVWSAVSGDSLVHVDDDAPENPATGQLWFDTDNGTLNLFDGDDWINIATGSKTIFTLPVSSRSGVVQLPVSEDADSLPVSLRSGESAIPLNQSGDILAVNTRGGEIQLPLAS